MKEAIVIGLVVLALYAGLTSTCEGQRMRDRALAKLLGGASCCDGCAKHGATCAGAAPNLRAMGVEVAGASDDGLDDGSDGGADAGVALARGCAS